MNPDLLRHYNLELGHLREMGAEFAAEFPKIASRLRMDGLEVADPYVERLLEGFAFMAARIQLKLDAGFPRFTQRLLDLLHPQYLAPIPSMLIAQIEPQPGEASLLNGMTIARGSRLQGAPAKAGVAPCQFRTAQELTLWPVALAGASYFSHAANLSLAGKPELRAHGGGVRLSLRTLPGASFSQLGCTGFRFHCSGMDEVAYKLHELICGQSLGVFVGTPDGRSELVGGAAITPVGLEDEHALLPVSRRGFQGFRLLQEYFAFPQRFLFFDIDGIGDALRRLGGSQADISILFSRGDPGLQQTVGTDSFALHCVPAINLFEHRCDRIHVTPGAESFHVVPDRARPMDFEIHEVLEVIGHGSSLESERHFVPLYGAFRTDAGGDQQGAYFTTLREPRLLSAVQRRDGPRSSYIGSEVSISIVDQDEAPFPSGLQQLSVRALCSNRDLPLLMAAGGRKADLRLDQTAPVASVRVMKGPSRPLAPQRGGHVAWQLISQLTLNHIALDDRGDGGQGAAVLREVLRLYVPAADPSLHRQIEGVRSLRTKPVVRRLSMPGPIAFGRGVELEVGVDELGFEGGSAFLLGCVLDRFFARGVSLNAFTQTRVRSQTRGEIYAGRPRCGTRPVL